MEKMEKFNNNNNINNKIFFDSIFAKKPSKNWRSWFLQKLDKTLGS
jgi:hypothetical protein